MAEVVLEMVANPVASSQGREWTEDSNAVLSFCPKEHRMLGKAYTNGVGAPSLLFRWLQLMTPLLALYLVLRGEMGDEFSWHVQPSTLGKISHAAQAFQFMVMLLPLAAARRVLCDGGELDQLGCGTVKISQSDAQYLARWRVVLTGVGTFFSVMLTLSSILIFATAAARFRGTPAEVAARCDGVIGLSGSPSAGFGNGCSLADRNFAVITLWQELSMTSNGKFVLLGHVMSLALPVLAAFMYTNMLAATLARDSVTEVIKAAQESDPTDKETWMKNVAKPALKLEETLEMLSRGWGQGFLGVILMVWSGAFHAFCQGVNKPRVAQIAYMRGETSNESMYLNFVFSALASVLPLLFLTDVASTSNRCDHLLDELNNMRKIWGPQCNEEITWLETSLMRLNRGQGLGFTISGVVIDRRFLKNLAMAIGGGMTTLITAVIALSEEPPHLVGGPDRNLCEPTEAQIAQVQLSFGGSSANCSYDNLTIGSML